MGAIERARDAFDIARRARSVIEIARALAPPALRSRRVLNTDSMPTGVPPELAAERMRVACNRVRAAAVSPDGRAVDYAALRDDPALSELARAAADLVALTPHALRTDPERIAFWCNVYNTLVVHGIVALGIRESVMEVPSFFGSVAYRVGDYTLTPDEIENGVLRRNRRHPATRRRVMPDDHPALAFCPGDVDPRIHMALVCAAAGCPPIAFYTAEGLDAELDLAAAGFVASEVAVAPDAIVLSALFRYYPEDFGGDEGIRAFVEQHATGDQREAIERANADGLPLRYRRYDWTLNAS